MSASLDCLSDGAVKSVGPFITGPADVPVLKDGLMLISDDFDGAMYRVTDDAASVGR